MKKILFICLGNICRSPAADGVMTHLVKEAKREKDILIDSAGIGDWHIGQLPDARMRQTGMKRGYQFDHKARQFQTSDFSRFDHIYVMDNENYRIITQMARTDADKNKVEMLADCLREHQSATIPDPYYGTMDDFDYALDLIEDACSHLLEEL
ncbi:putative low molecular weight protein-tyrosine-phosphatase [Prevotella sp. DNF00663]|uniref:low molecular weight protein-tyrosine-phosphatase n=1 Tax=unclassified Prevotella TaxID=2638335 RepID=UPI000512D1DC|nr:MULTISPECIES: low molecular weight protein-tyrosine-phosphatase [unclassified Prevotella]KGI60969.1 protein tyrosine phosphatase [Prevotella sp. S7 MS 2]KXB80627.1 putative low molecular weight protein-tyrosine-phosphatase [Prevotella sp. DNF00663]